jgi:hypothetical protein
MSALSENELRKVIERVQKLLALAGNNTNENEALAAIEKAHAILAEHNLDLNEIEAHEARPHTLEEEQRVRDDTDTTLSENYYGWIWNAVAKAHYCSAFVLRPSNRARQTYHILVGRQINVLVAKQLALYLCQTIRRLANEEAKRVGRSDHAFKNAFLAGAATRISQRVRDMKFGDAKQQNALVLWADEEFRKNAEFIGGTRERKSRPTRYNVAGYKAGHAAGDRVSLAQQVKGKSSSTLALR